MTSSRIIPNTVIPTLEGWEWTQNAACKGLGFLFYSPHWETKTTRALRVTAALTICENCPARDECRQQGEIEQQGIWGGHDYDADLARNRERYRTRPSRPVGGPCELDHCTAPQKARGLCSAHYSQWARNNRNELKTVIRQGLPEHGTTARYRRGCRCEPCRDARRQVDRRTYLNKKQTAS